MPFDDLYIQDFAIQWFVYSIFGRNYLFKILLFKILLFNDLHIQYFVGIIIFMSVQDIDDQCFKVQDFAMHPMEPIEPLYCNTILTI